MREINQQGALDFQPPEGFIDRFLRIYDKEVLDWASPRWQGVMKGRTSREFAMTLFVELKKYLVVKAALAAQGCDKLYSPTTFIDPLWHHFIIDDTQVYDGFCEQYLGAKVHHQNQRMQEWDQEFYDCSQRLGIKFERGEWECAQCG